MDYLKHFETVLGVSQIFDSLSDRKKFVDLFYQFQVGDTIYPFWCKLFDETSFFVDLGNEIGRDIFTNGFIEPSVSLFLYNHIKRGDGFIDGGAHMGYYSKIATCKVGDNGYVFSLEPNPNIWKIFEMNHSRTSNLQLIKKAISDNGEKKTLYSYGNNYSPYNSLKKNNRIFSNNVNPVETIDCESVMLSDLIIDLSSKISNLNKIWIKLDIEGLELDVISASIDTIVKQNCIVIFEGGFSLDIDRKLIDLFIKKRYEIFLFEDLTTTSIDSSTHLPEDQTLYYLARSKS